MSRTERYTLSVSFDEMRMVEVFNIATGLARTGSPQWGQFSLSPSKLRLHARHRIAIVFYLTARRGPFTFSCADSPKFSRTT